MQYRSIGKTGIQASALGFGCMRLPTMDQNRFGSAIDEAEAIRMLRYAIDAGVNYIDTAYPYHAKASEIVVGKALQDGYRDRVQLATKSPTWLLKSESDFDKYLDEQLKKLQTDHIDFYLLHSLDLESWKDTILKLRVLDYAEKARQDGRIRYLGFSFHDEYPAFVQIVDGYDRWDFCQIQYNYMDTENQAGLQGLRHAAEKGLGIVIMEPLLGGKLAVAPPAVQALFDQAAIRRTPADWALQWLWNQPEVSLVLSGMSTMRQVDENIQSAQRSGIDTLQSDDLSTIGQAAAFYKSRAVIPCTACQYCMPCPNGVDIPHNFKVYNDGIMFDDQPGARIAYTRFTGEAERAARCIQCRICEEKCPQRIVISEWMPQIDAALGPG